MSMFGETTGKVQEKDAFKSQELQGSAMLF